MLDIDASVCTQIIDMYNEHFGVDARLIGRNLNGFAKEYVLSYLSGK